MANTKFSALTVDTTMGASDFLAGVQDVGGTPAPRRYGHKAVRNPVVVAVTVSATPTINTDNGELFIITSQNVAITSMTTNLTGTPASGEVIRIEILDNGTARVITWGASFASGTGTLPTTTTVNKWLYVVLEWSASRSKWICQSAGSEQ